MLEALIEGFNVVDGKGEITLCGQKRHRQPPFWVNYGSVFGE